MIKDKNHHHLFIYMIKPGLGECECGAYKVHNRQLLQSYEERDREVKSERG